MTAAQGRTDSAEQMSDGRALLFIHEWNERAYARQRVRDGEVSDDSAQQDGDHR